jgi:hypothetical protein
MLYLPEAAQGRLVFLGQVIPVRAEDVANDARRPGTRVRFDLTWEHDDLRAFNVRRTRAPRARERWSPADQWPKVPSGTGPSALPAASGGDSVEGGSER